MNSNSLNNSANNTQQPSHRSMTDSVNNPANVSDTAQNETHDESNVNSFSERRPKPIRGVGYGDIFAAGAKTKPSQTSEAAKATGGLVSSIVASERLNSGLIGSTLQKPIPKKPPPPTPAAGSIHESGAQNGSINTTSDQAPALPPKPSNQSFSPFMQTRSLPQPPAASLMPTGSTMQASQRSAREQARVIHAYDPTNDDELELKVNDIINIIDKKSEDYGWWKGELNGKIGVFPDNFVQLIPVQDQQVPVQSSQASTATNQTEWPSNRIGTSSVMPSTASSVFSPPQQQQANLDNNRVKSVFSSTPKGFSKELEINLEKHSSNPASFLSLKRNRLSGNDTSSVIAPSNNTQLNMGFVSTITKDETTNLSSSNGHAPPSNPLETTSPTKLNHITANRAKGPSRRPPSNILNKRNLANSDPYGVTKEKVLSPSSPNESPKNEPPQLTDNASILTASNNHDDTSNDPNNSELNQRQPLRQTNNLPVPPATQALTSSGFTGSTATNNAPSGGSTSSTKPSSFNTTPVDTKQTTPVSVPKTSQRVNQQVDNSPKTSGQKTPNVVTDSPPSSTPPWMVNLRKTNAEKKRDTSTTSTTAAPMLHSTAIANVVTPSSNVGATNNNVTSTSTVCSTILQDHCHSETDNNPGHQAQSKPESSTNSAPAPAKSSETVSVSQLNESLAKYDSLFKQISKDVTSELTEMKRDVKRLQEELTSMSELKSEIETMKTELRACQSATESQRKYIKELVNNLADERKKIAAMQEELDRNLK